MKCRENIDLEQLSHGGIYTIHNLLDNKFYIGSAKNFFKRWILHKCLLNKNKHHSPYLQHAWNKYGEDAFAFLPLHCVNDKETRLKIEQKFLDTLCPEYNISKKATSCEGTIRSKETRKKMSAAVRKPERLNKFIAYAKLPKSNEHKRKISEAHKGKKASEETRQKLKDAWKLRKLNNEK